MGALRLIRGNLQKPLFYSKRACRCLHVETVPSRPLLWLSSIPSLNNAFMIVRAGLRLNPVGDSNAQDATTGACLWFWSVSCGNQPMDSFQRTIYWVGTQLKCSTNMNGTLGGRTYARISRRPRCMVHNFGRFAKPVFS